MKKHKNSLRWMRLTRISNKRNDKREKLWAKLLQEAKIVTCLLKVRQPRKVW